MIDKTDPKQLRALPSVNALLHTQELIEGRSAIGGGSAPTIRTPTVLLALTHESLSADELERALRVSNPPLIGRVAEGKVLLDLRTVAEHEETEVLHVLARVRDKTDSRSAKKFTDRNDHQKQGSNLAICATGTDGL